MKTSAVLHAWSRILAGRAPSLSIEITRECPLRCPGCYAFDPAHLGGEIPLRQLSDFRGDELVSRVLALVDDRRPLHVSLVGGDPLVRYRELDRILPELARRGIHTQVVTSAFRTIPSAWTDLPLVRVVVSIDGLPAEHDVRRAPATYERILRSIAGARVTIHSTITAQIAGRPGYLDEFLRFWSQRPEIARVWFSLFTPQRGAEGPEILTPSQRAAVVADLRVLATRYPILEMPDSVLRELEAPPSSPADCIFAQTTETLSADLRTRVTPCQFGGDPDCSQCGCFASMALAAVGHYRVGGGVTAGRLFQASDRIGKRWRAVRETIFVPAPPAPEPSPFRILDS